MHKRRHNGHMGGGGGQRRHHGGGHHRSGGGGNNFNRPRKNYLQLREKYLNMARDAMSSGDRVMAEYYMQHAEHCFRMQQEFNAERAARYQQNAQAVPEDNVVEDANGGGETAEDMVEELNQQSKGGALPSFITRSTPASGQPAPVPPQNWEEE